MKVLTVVGARPQFVKSFALSRALGDVHDETLVHTGQHYDEELSDLFFAELGLAEPAYDLGVGSAGHTIQTASMMRELDPVVSTEDPEVMVVFGDTNSTLAGALVGAKRDVVLAHVEAGLRSGNRSMPEEHNRVVTDHLADLLFAPSASARDHLEAEGLGARTYVTGDVMYDAILWASSVATETSTIVENRDLEGVSFVLATVHRPRNTDDRERLESILDGFATVESEVVLPIHPRTADRLRDFGLQDRAGDAATIIDPVGYVDFVRLLAGAACVATDSGGVQKEALFLETPCVTLRAETEWPETVEAGWNVLVDAEPDGIRRAIAEAERPAGRPECYGDGNAAERIAGVLADV